MTVLSFLWIVANFLGLAYGAAVMIEETDQIKIAPRDVDLLNHHIGVSHSNLEDLLLFVVAGSLVWVDAVVAPVPGYRIGLGTPLRMADQERLPPIHLNTCSMIPT